MRKRLCWLAIPTMLCLLYRPAPAAEPALHCQWTNPNTKQPLALTFQDNPLIVALPGQTIILSSSCQGATGQVTIFKDDQPIRTSQSISLAAPEKPGSYFIPLALEAGGMRRDSEICIFVPHKATARRAPKGLDVIVDGENIGFYRDPALSGNQKVRDNPASYQPPVWWLRITDTNAHFSLVPGLKADDLVVASEDTGTKHTDTVPVCYPMWLTVHSLRAALETRGIPGSALKLISVYRAPAYNRGIGSNAYGRHIFGDAFDFYIDLEGDEKASDLNQDRRRDRRDAYPVVAVIEDLMADGKIPMGGIGIYNTVGGDHEVTMHYDARGHRATWGFHFGASGKKSNFAWASRRFADLDRHEENLAAERASREGRSYVRPNREPLQ